MNEGSAELRRFDADSKFDTDWAFLQELFKAGRRAAKRWLARDDAHAMTPEAAITP
ncbi:MAG: hypothetical protein KGQ77_04000 [Betaproteobacteria bacterium]|nr:hypothetical protein [Betaproteobacteria bacterium]